MVTVVGFSLVWFSDARAVDEKSPVLVTSEWLSQHLNDPDIVVIHVAQSIRGYRNEHIPGARFLWVPLVAAATPELSFELVPVERLDTLMEGLGISNESRVILCGFGGNVSATARMYVTFEYLGMGDHTSILDGGFQGWKDAGRPVSKETPPHRRSSFTPQLHHDAIVDAKYVSSHMDAPGIAILDARAPEFYSGKSSNGFPRAGHIPGAHNLFYTTLFDTTDRYLPLDSLKARFAAAGIKPDDDIITYCHVGQTASSDYVAAKVLGHTVHLYDGSFEDWSSQAQLPITVEATKDTVRK